MEEFRKRELLRLLDEELLSERSRHLVEPLGIRVPDDVDGMWMLFRALVNVRPPEPATPEFLERQDELLHGLIREHGIASPDDAAPSPADARMRLWRGDITCLAADAIVNAANSQMLGCWQPGHSCIDNAIHTYAGVQLRRECADIMAGQGHEEPTGRAKITRAYNLPARHVIHTVGPIAAGAPTDGHRAQLAQCYRSCLDCAARNGLHSIAFCCISTGVFGFPQDEAARIAVHSVREWLAANGTRAAGMTVVFDVFGERDEELYRQLLDIG